MNVQSESCPVCGNSVTYKAIQGRTAHQIKCRRCGEYIVSWFLEGWPAFRADVVHLISGYIRSENEKGNIPKIPSHIHEEIHGLIAPPRTIEEKIDKIVNHIVRKSPSFGKQVTIDSFFDYPIIFSQDQDELNFCIEEAKASGLLKGDPPTGKTVGKTETGPIQTQIHSLIVTRQGWEKYEALSPNWQRGGPKIRIDKLIENGESETVEFKSTLSKNLKTKQKDKEIEKSCLKTITAFLNSDGGTLIIGIEDSGNPIGFQQDVFPTEDKMSQHLSNLIRDHIGLEHIPNVNFDFMPYAGKNLLVVECRPSDSPVHLKYGNEEDFFIRAGSTTQVLTMSKADAYKKARFSNIR